MGKHSGKNLKVSVGGDFIAGCMGFSFSEKAGTAEITSADDTAKDYDPLHTDFDGKITMRLDHSGVGQTLRAGDVIAFQGYTEGDGSGKTYVAGSAIVTEHSIDVAYDGVAGREYSLQGKGALSLAAVA